MAEYRITHIYVTRDDDDHTVLETETREGEIHEVSAIVAEMVEHPGGRSGTTIALSITLIGSGIEI